MTISFNTVANFVRLVLIISINGTNKHLIITIILFQGERKNTKVQYIRQFTSIRLVSIQFTASELRTLFSMYDVYQLESYQFMHDAYLSEF